MKKTLIYIVILCFLLIGCGESGVSQEEYDRIVAERDNYKLQLTALLNEKEANNESATSDYAEPISSDNTETSNDTNIQPSSQETLLSTGTYVIGEDIDAGKYSFYATKGAGSLKIYLTYEDYKNDEYGLDAFLDFDILTDGASVGLLNEDIYTDSIYGIRLENEYCLVIEKGLELQYEPTQSPPSDVLNVGIYIVGDDIESGKYDFTAIRGSGSIKIYNSYDEYLSDIYGFDAFADYDMKEKDASVGLLNEDIYSQSINNIRLEDGQCLFIEKGLKIKYSIK